MIGGEKKIDIRETALPPRTSAHAQFRHVAGTGEAAKLVTEACGEPNIPFTIQFSPEARDGLEPLEQACLRPYLSRVRPYLPNAELKINT